MCAGRTTLSVALALAAGATFAPLASATEFSAHFNADNDGFSTNSFGSGDPLLSASEYVAEDGNPDGFIRYTDPDSGVPEATKAHFWTSAGPDLDHLGGAVSVDIRSNASGTLDGAFVAVQDYSAENILICALGNPGVGWTSFSASISANEPCWKDGNDNTDATPADMQTLFAGEEGFWFANADLGSGASEVTDLDNFVIEAAKPPLLRALTIKYKKRVEAFSGLLTQSEGPGGDECVQSVKVQLYQDLAGEDKLLGSDRTDESGRWKVKKRARKDKLYYALAPAITEPSCAEARSNTTEPL